MARSHLAFPLLTLILASSPLLLGQEVAGSVSPETVTPTLRHPIMRLDHKAHERRKFLRENLPQAYIDPAVHYMLRMAQQAGATASVNLLPYFAYTPSSWNQQQCGDCWVWAGTAASSIEMALHGRKDLISVQYFNSSYNNGTGSGWAGCGGFAADFAQWYDTKKLFVPWSNTNAGYVDGNKSGCPDTTAMKASSISTNPNYPITSVQDTVVTTLNVGQTTAINNIKTLLNQNRPVLIGFYLPTNAGWNDFENYWNNKTETDIFQIDQYNGQTWETNGGGGHEVLVVGYDDTDRSWLALNSWGTTAGRPNGLFRIPQTINYDTYFVDQNTKYNSFDFDIYNFTWPSSSNTVAATITTPGSDITLASGTNQAFAGTATDSSSTATLSYGWNFGDGSTAAGAAASHTFTNTTSNPVTYCVTFTATDNTGAKGSAVRNVTVNPPATNSELIKNGGFESGNTGWSATYGVIGQNGPNEPAYAGTYDAWLCGYGRRHSDSLYQTVTIPANSSSATLSFYLHIDTADTSHLVHDTFTAQLRKSSGASLRTLATFNNTNASSGYSRMSFDVSAYKGQTIQVYFAGSEDLRFQTSFVLDNVSLVVR